MAPRLLDLYNAYLQLEVQPEYNKYLGISTPWGQYTQRRLPFGLHNSAQIFQCLMDQLLGTMEGVVYYLDDILIFGRGKNECILRTEKVVKKFTKHNIKVRKDKNLFFVEKLIYLGFEVSAGGVKVSPKKIQPILDAPKSQNITKLRSFFLSMTMFYHRHIRNMSMLTINHHKLTSKNNKWLWTQKHTEKFRKLKSATQTALVLQPFQDDL